MSVLTDIDSSGETAHNFLMHGKSNPGDLPFTHDLTNIGQHIFRLSGVLLHHSHLKLPSPCLLGTQLAQDLLGDLWTAFHLQIPAAATTLALSLHVMAFSFRVFASSATLVHIFACRLYLFPLLAMLI